MREMFSLKPKKPPQTIILSDTEDEGQCAEASNASQIVDLSQLVAYESDISTEDFEDEEIDSDIPTSTSPAPIFDITTNKTFPATGLESSASDKATSSLQDTEDVMQPRATAFGTAPTNHVGQPAVTAPSGTSTPFSCGNPSNTGAMSNPFAPVALNAGAVPNPFAPLSQTTMSATCHTGALLPRVPLLKRKRLDVPFRVQRAEKKKRWTEELDTAWKSIVRLLASKKTKWESGGLQERRARAIECHLRLIMKNNRSFITASRISAEAHRFGMWSGSRSLRKWTRQWMKERALPTSKKGRHAKVFSLLSDPAITAELRAYLRSNKWAMNPERLRQFTEDKLIPTAANAYLQQIINVEMPKGLKQYMEDVLFPRVQLKVGRGISLSTARQWMTKEGFRFISYKKGLYFDGHDRPDVVDYRQNSFLPMMAEHGCRLVKFCPGQTEEEWIDPQTPSNFVERRLVLCAHDEMTAQANDSMKKTWVLEDQHQLRKKGVGRGIHQSDIICSTFGWLKEASQTLEYGKNYEGYWTGELFIKQVCLLCYFTQNNNLL